ncbi:MAG: hypothetical protein IGS03_14720 [Candidatus Sericytochromatia bacterium]|nr:hypothetical protein [Candidatus Sericytochromatia bacterium]
MALKFPQYLMRDGVTRLGEDYFNPVWRDLDGRLDTLEKLKISWQTAVSEIQQFGIQRIDTVLAPVIEDITTTLASANAAAAELQQIIEDADIQTQLDAAFDDQNNLVNEALDEVKKNQLQKCSDIDQMLSLDTDALSEIHPDIYALVADVGLFKWSGEHWYIQFYIPGYDVDFTESAVSEQALALHECDARITALEQYASVDCFVFEFVENGFSVSANTSYTALFECVYPHSVFDEYDIIHVSPPSGHSGTPVLGQAFMRMPNLVCVPIINPTAASQDMPGGVWVVKILKRRTNNAI